MLNKLSSSFNHSKLALIWLILVVLSCALLLKQWGFSSSVPIETDIMKLLPQSRQDPLAQVAFDKITSSVSDKVVFVLKGSDDQKLFAAAETFQDSLLKLSEFVQITGKIDQQKQNAWSRYYFSHRFQFLTDEQRTRLQKAPDQQVQKVIQTIYNPFSGVTGSELSSDPFLLFRDYLSQLNQLTTQFQIQKGFLTTQYQNDTFVLITATLADSPYSMSAQQVVPKLMSLEQALKTSYDVESAHTGVLFYADFGTQSAKSEISTIGLFSLLGVVVVILFVFRSAAPLLMALLSISVGLLVALVATTAIFGKVHLFSLVFGASLIGVSIDYAFHYLTDRLAAQDKWDSIKGLKHIFTAITLGLITSLIGYLGLLIAPFPGLQQLALFSALGLIAAYATVVAWYPILARKATPQRTLPGKKLWRWWLALWQKRSTRIALPAVLLLLSAVQLVQVNYDDDIRQLQAMPQALKKQEDIINQVSGVKSSQQMLVVRAPSDEALLTRLEQLDNTLGDWKKQQAIMGYQSLSQYLPSMSRQKTDYQLVQTLYQNYASSLAQLLKLSAQPSLDETMAPVSLADYLKQSVSEPVQFLYLGKVGEDFASVIMLREVNNAEQIKAFANKNMDISYLDKAEEISTLFGEYRTKVMELLIAALVGISLLLARRYGFSHMLRIVFPCVIACLVGIAVTTLTGSTLNLFNLLALVLVIGIGIDYTLFFAEQAQSRSTLLAITLSAMTTLLSFGLLSLSETHAIHSFGLTTLSGIFVAWLLSPLAIKRQINQ
ncbi:MMPL family transporter [Vibrio ziniensis]|uniref:MMPL family transporter n=1 Tax=Vibrio ziniensis TaxID=2711221 RepID=A0A6G7CJC7_9VIBR|nr:MMPL family transporter [Vibrio ziniensis]QIH42184.1 MMPL family transporter [Vibrio ziniensis]